MADGRATTDAGDAEVPRPVPILRMACIVVVLAGLYFGKTILLPIVLAAFLAILAYKPMRWLHERRVPTWAALLIVMLTAVAVIGGFGLVVGNAVAEFAAAIPAYTDDIQSRASGLFAWIQDQGIDVDALRSDAQEQTRKLVPFLTRMLGDVVSVLSDVVLILLVMAFMLAEGAGMPNKLRRALGRPDLDLSAAAHVMDQVYGYVAIKTWISAITGLLFGLATWAIGVPFPVLWGVLAFALNFVPNVGPVLSLVPPAVVALVQLGPSEAGLVVLANLGVNQVLGNVVEPRVMGKRLGLSPLVVILSLLFWAFLWGPIGMILSVPLTMVVKIVMEQSPEWRTVGLLLGPADPEPLPPAPRAP